MAPNAGLQLFPPPPSKKKSTPVRRPSGRRTHSRTRNASMSALERAASPPWNEDGQQITFEIANGRQSAMDQRQSFDVPDRTTPSLDIYGRASPRFDVPGRASPVPGPSQAPPEHPRSHTSMSEAPTLVRSSSRASHSSIAKVPFPPASPTREEPVIRSIFPRYNPEVPLEQQQYYPTAASPTHIPRAVISKQPYSPSIAESNRPPLRSPMSAGSSVGRFPPGCLDVPVKEPSTNEEVKELWKCTNGWRVSPSEGRTYCLKMNSSPETPVHTLSSASQPFYTLQLDPTSTSALLTLTRQDPSIKNKRASSKPFEVPRSGLEVLTTTLEEESRRLPPNDGLVALLYPRAASNMVIELAAKANRQGGEDPASIVAAAELECGRLVWDDDTKTYYLVHPASPTPFRIQITAAPAWSKVEYALEHPELPGHMVRLTRDGAGGGYLEIDTGIAARVNCFYIVDVAISAVMIVALSEEKLQKVEHFDAPPPSVPGTPRTKKELKEFKKELKKSSSSPHIHEFEMDIDLESQDSLKKAKENLPRPARGLLGCLFMGLKCLVWILTMGVKAAAKVIIWASEKLAKRTGGSV